jgi:hypothetical protein
MYIRPIDERGWLVPREGTKFREVYGLMIHGMESWEISKVFPTTNANTIRQMIHRIKNPKPLRLRKQRARWIMVTESAAPPSLSV